MAEDTTIRDAIIESAAGPKKVADDSTVMEQHSLTDMIAADNHTKNKTAVDENPNGGIRYRRLTQGNDW